MTKPVSKTIDAANPTQLDGAKDKATKKPKSTKRVNQPKSANSSDSVNSENQIDAANAMNMVSEATLFADELVPSVKPEGTSEHYESIGGNSTDSKNESVELSPANSSDEKKTSDGDIALDLAPPAQLEESGSTIDVSSSPKLSSPKENTSQSEINPLKESDSAAELNEIEEADELNGLNKSDESNSDIAMNKANELTPSSELTPPTESKPTRVSAKMRRQELDDYVKRFLQPGQIAKRHTVVIEEETWKRISYNVRKIGLEDSTGSAYVEAIIRDHIDRYEDKVEEWRKL